jgi:cyclophilin family peptidyl-prolyl cis-trans isomerase
MTRPLLALLVTATAALGLAACGGDEDPQEAGTTAATSAAPAAAPSPGPGCTGVTAPEPKGEGELDAPDEQLDPERKHVLTLKTNCGSFEIALAVKRAPKTASSVAALARDGFYDGLTFHRIVPGFVVQGGDPQGDGQGGPGYSVVEAPPKGLQYRRGIVAMAKTQIEDPGTSGSQFFVVTGPDAGLPPEYALLGEVTKGMDVVERIGDVRTDPATEMPAAPVVIESATVRSEG